MSVKPSNQSHPALSALAQRWHALSPREQALLSWGGTLLAVALVWWIALAPALRTLHEAPAQQARLDVQWQQLQALQAQAQSLQQQPRMTPAEAMRALQQTTTELLGASAQIQTQGERSTITFKAVPATALAQWMTQARTRARAVPVQARWQREANADKGNANKASNTIPGAPLWSGTIVVSLPAP